MEFGGLQSPVYIHPKYQTAKPRKSKDAKKKPYGCNPHNNQWLQLLPQGKAAERKDTQRQRDTESRRQPETERQQKRETPRQRDPLGL